jgi:hypothetical protein
MTGAAAMPELLQPVLRCAGMSARLDGLFLGLAVRGWRRLCCCLLGLLQADRCRGVAGDTL